MIKAKVAFLEGRLLSNQLEQFEKFSKRSPIWYPVNWAQLSIEVFFSQSKAIKKLTKWKKNRLEKPR